MGSQEKEQNLEHVLSGATESEWSGEEEDEGDHEERLTQKRSILWLCQEGQIHLARQRIEMLMASGKSECRSAEKLRKEIFQVGRDKNYPLHEILMGGSSDQNAYAATLAILEVSSKYPIEQQTMLSAMPPSHMRTPLHWAAWGNAKIEILVALVNGHPEALLLRDKKSQGQRTPLEILKRYFRADRKIPFLERATTSWISHRVGVAVHLAANRYFGTVLPLQSRLVPFDRRHRNEVSMKPKPWFLLSVIGFLMQREMKPLALKILSYVGGNEKMSTKTKKRRTATPNSGRRQRVCINELGLG